MIKRILIVGIIFGIIIVLVACIGGPSSLYGNSSAESLPDLSGYSYNELITLHNRIRLALWNLDGWQSVTVSPGVWEIGVDIPAGHWTIKADVGLGPSMIVYASAVKDQGHDVDILSGDYIIDYVCSPSSPYYSGDYKTETDFILEEGHFLRIDCTMIFTPFSGKPVFDFH